MSDERNHSLEAVLDFRRARRRAGIEDLLARLRGQPADLLPFEEVRRHMRSLGSTDRGLRDIPLDAIVGSVGRYADFNRHFLPRRANDWSRWSRVWTAVSDPEGVPPIEVYKVGEVYFVQDGNHRVSVARSIGATHIQGHVNEILTRVPLTPADSPDDVIIKSEYADFLERTRLDERHPDAQLFVTATGRHQHLLDEIEIERYRMALESGQAAALTDAADYWYRERYLPIVEMIRERGLLHDFPGRTEADLYSWIAEHRAALAEELGWSVAPEAVASELASRESPLPTRVAARLGARILDTIRPATMAPGPAPGAWRRDHPPDGTRLFADILVPVGGDEVSANALAQALAIARREQAQLHGLHIVASFEQRNSPQAQAIQSDFARRCDEADVVASTSVASGEVASLICAQARWVDLVVVQVNHPPEPQPLGRLRSGLRELIQRCPRPVLAVPGTPSPLARALLAYDGSPKADEALFVGAYLALQWGVALVVATVPEAARTDQAALDHARHYLDERGVAAEYLVGNGPVAEALLRLAESRGCDLIISGGYGLRPELALLLGSTVDALLRHSPVPLLICR